jgi:hypothetical protein
MENPMGSYQILKSTTSLLPPPATGIEQFGASLVKTVLAEMVVIVQAVLSCVKARGAKIKVSQVADAALV